MKHDLFAATALILASVCTPQGAGNPGLPSVRLTGHDRGGDMVAVTDEDNRTVVDVCSRAGIGRVELTCPDEGWRRPVVIRLHLGGLEGLNVSNGTFTVHTSVLSHRPYRQLCELFQAGEGTGSPLEESSPFWMPLRVENRSEPGQRVIPLEAGYFEVTLPDTLLDGDPETLMIQWIDFLRG